MKIIIIGPAHPLRGGLAAFNERMARALQQEGHEVEIYSFSLQYPKILFPGKTQFTDAPAPAGLKIISRINSINPFNWESVGREIKNRNPDLVIVAYW
ncbi:MAG TPA: glycosyl transferase family 1, partial [Bacteroidia bacterium]